MEQTNIKKSANPSITAEVFDDWSFVEQYQRDWSEMISAHEQPTIFLSTHWLLQWWDVFAEETDLLQVVILFSEQKVISIAPFYIKNQKELRFIGTGEPESKEVASEFLDILITPSYRESVIEYFSNNINYYFPQISGLVFGNVLADSNIARVVENIDGTFYTQKQVVGARYLVDLPSSFTEYLASLDSKFVSQMMRKRKKFERLGGKVVTATSEKQALFYLGQLEKLHTNRWNNINKQGAFADLAFRKFHSSFIKTLLKHDLLSLTALSINEQPLAIIYNFKFLNSYAFYQIGADFKFRPNMSPGTLIHLYEIEDSIEKGYEYYDFMKGTIEHSYKASFTKAKHLVYNISCHKICLENFSLLIKYWLRAIRKRLYSA